jgi:hypothetical protein
MSWATMTKLPDDAAMDESLRRKLKRMPKTSQPELMTEIESGKNKGSSSDDELELRGQSMRGDQ